MPAQVRHLTDRAVRIAIAERRVTALIFPNDLQDLKYEEPPRAHGTLHSGVRRRKSSPTSGSCARPPTC
jgi:pyruvate dehydrogenase (quinone)